LHTTTGKPRTGKTTTPSVKVPDRTIAKMSEVLKLMADKHRLKILLALAQHGKINVQGLGKLVGQSQPAVSHHLSKMRAVGLIDFDRRGKENFYFLDSALLRDLLDQFFSGCGNGHRELSLEEFSLVYKRK
jgi:ArsR family transcriptional regulator